MMKKKLKRICFIFLCLLLTFEQSGFAQVAAQLDISSHLAGLHNSFFPDKFRPLHLRYISYDVLNNNFKLLLDKGDLRTPPSKVELEEKTKILLNYFFIGISLPNDSFWVNLRPDAEDNIIAPELAKTDVGKILLEADLQLKKDTAEFTSPETPEGKQYWDKLYQKAGELFGSENITIPTLTRPWIVPDEIIIRESQDNAYIYKATLKVMLEQDYLKNSAMYSFKDERLKVLNEYSSQLIRELIIPKLTKEINTSKRYAPLKQVYYSLILAQWFKSRFYGKGGLYSSLIDRRNLNGLTSKTAWSKTTYFQAYQASFKDGEYNIKEPVYTPYGQSIRSYFSGGITVQNTAAAAVKVLPNRFTNALPSGLMREERTAVVLCGGGSLQNLAAVNIDLRQGRIEIIKNDLYALVEQRGITSADEIELDKLANRIYDAQLSKGGIGFVEVDTTGINVPGITTDLPDKPALSPIALGMMGMGGTRKKQPPAAEKKSVSPPLDEKSPSAADTSTIEATMSFLKTDLYNYLVGLCRNSALVRTRGIKLSSYRQLLIRARSIDHDIADYLELLIGVISKITLFEGADEDNLEEAVIALNDHGLKKYGLCISLDPLVYRESLEEKPLLTSLDYKIYRILDVESALNPLTPENRINAYVLDKVVTDYRGAVANISPLLIREKSGHMFKDREALAAKVTGLAGPKVYLKEAKEEIESAKIGPSGEINPAISLLGELVRQFYTAERDDKLLKLEQRRIAAHEVGHVYTFFTVSEELDEEKDELLAYLYSLMENLEGNKAYLAKLIIKAIQIESSDVKYFDPTTGSIYIPSQLQAFITLKGNFKNVLGIPNKSNLELANRIAKLNETDIPELAKRIFKAATGKDPIEIAWQTTSPGSSPITRKEKLEYVRAIYDGVRGARVWDTSSNAFRTMSIYNYYYRSGSFRAPTAYSWQIEKLGKELGSPDLFNGLLSFVKRLTVEDGRVFYLYSVINPNGSLGLGLRSSILEGDPLLTTSRKDFYGQDNFTIFVGQELFEYLTRRNCAEDLSDIDLFITFELIWQEILRYYFKEASPKVIARIKAAIENEANEERKFQKELSPVMREALNASSGWDSDLGEDEIYVRALARKLSEAQHSASAKFYGWREIGVALFDNDLIERINENLPLDVPAIESGQRKALPPPNKILQPDKLLTISSEDIPGVPSSELALAIVNEAVKRGLLARDSHGGYYFSSSRRIAQLSEQDLGLFRYLLILKDELLKTEGVQREFRLIGSHLPEPIGQAVAFLEVAFFPPVGANFSSSLGKFIGGGEETTKTSPMVVYNFSPNVSFSFRARKRSERDYEIQITPMDDPHKSPVTVVRIPKDASFEEVLVRVIMALPEQPKALFYNTSIQGFIKLANLLLRVAKNVQIKILRELSEYMGSHTQQRAFNDELPFGTEHIPPLVLANELAFLAQDPQKREAALQAMDSLQQVFGKNSRVAKYIKNLPRDKNSTDKKGNSPSPPGTKSLPHYTGSGDTSIHVALDDAQAKISAGETTSARELLEELIADLKAAQQAENTTQLMDKWNTRYPSDLPVDLLPGDIPKAIEDVSRLLLQIEGNRGASSPPGASITKNAVASPISDKGGIDFRGLPIVTQPVLVNQLSSSPVTPLSNLNINLDAEWGQIQNMLNAGIIPSSERIKEYIIASCQTSDFNQAIDKVLSCLANILRLQEDNCCITESAFREILSLLESDKSAEELTFALTNITPQPQDPKTQSPP